MHVPNEELCCLDGPPWITFVALGAFGANAEGWRPPLEREGVVPADFDPATAGSAPRLHRRGRPASDDHLSRGAVAGPLEHRYNRARRHDDRLLARGRLPGRVYGSRWAESARRLS